MSPVSHDQNFKNLILDYPRQALELFAPEEARHLDDSVIITPIRQEQLKERLGDRFHELDVPLLVEWPDGRREALLFIVEEESDPARFSIHRLVIYCASLAELYATDRIIPVVVFLRGSKRICRRLELGSEEFSFLSFTYLSCILGDLPAEAHLHSTNLVARLNLPNMRHPRRLRVEVHAQAVRGLLDLEPDTEKRLKYIDFVDIYGVLDDNEKRIYAERYAQEDHTMAGLTQRLSERFLTEGRQQGIQQGILQGMQMGRSEGELIVLTRQLTRRFGPLDAAVSERLQKATSAELEQWADNFVDARTLNEVFDQG
ncbi:DUF4351 domain-containing protein [Thauera linaloolentis]|uniref:DUF4351 domain-containing protein n=1 Tax=Thauera linaloolentis (strain DSM 12138 / JCM 21573 / CCUG 41526 / CIP 105981 / IAM 15112 / NBRC 102519 / 47Lol) TaxID=1123367 RepID=N6ZEA3_THAL4|nr:DUF4351 domain-containing protein [Thauera linaloolentis]ENO90494.1 hypothetical protein C666_01280 [Thauera linaloolentis 47Lol = DSM 12138]MCM8566353.1 DUF4351 domain-containing protein [Thauera linaloolentis]